jgi:hypothetical protein
MRAVRTRLSWLFSLSLVLQLAGMTAPLVLSAIDSEIAGVCTCPAGVHGTTCPMHHGTTSQSPDRSNRCAMRSASVPTDMALLPLLSGAGLIPALNMFDVAELSSALAPVAGPVFAHRTDLPDPPPPRA